jgi:hypothetical protein
LLNLLSLNLLLPLNYLLPMASSAEATYPVIPALAHNEAVPVAEPAAAELTATAAEVIVA